MAESKRVKFNYIFTKYPDESLEPKRPVTISGISFGPGVRFSKGTSFAGVDFTYFTDKDFHIEEKDNGEIVIKGIYR